MGVYYWKREKGGADGGQAQKEGDVTGGTERRQCAVLAEKAKVARKSEHGERHAHKQLLLGFFPD